jgi:hypothetical protein
MALTLSFYGGISTLTNRGHKRKAPRSCLGCGALKSEHRGTLFAKVRGKPYIEVKAISVPTVGFAYKSLIYVKSRAPAGPEDMTNSVTAGGVLTDFDRQ